MGNQKSKILIDLKDADLQQLTKTTHFNEKEIKAMYKRYWGYCSPNGTINKQQFFNMLRAASDRGEVIVDHIFRTTDKDHNMSLGKDL